MKFLGHIINHQGVTADPAKTKAIFEMKPPKNLSELRRFAGMTNQLSKFIPRSADLMRPLTELLSSKCMYSWGPGQIQAFAKVKEVLTNTPLLAFYEPISDTKVSADASSFGLGAVILQRSANNPEWRPISFASRTMTY